MEFNPEKMAEAAIEKYCEWLNAWTAEDARRFEEVTQHVYKPEQFMVYDESRSLYGSYTLNGMISTGASSVGRRYIIELSMSDGDEGGATDLTLWIESFIDEDKYEIKMMVQGFDTDLQVIMQDGKWKELPEKEEAKQ